MRVPTANVIISFDRQIMNEFFSVGSTYKSLIQGLNKKGKLKDVLLFDNESNPNFISFEHSLMGTKMEMKLTFIDPLGEFERRFMTDNIPRNIAGYSSDPNLTERIEAEGISDTKEDVAYPVLPVGIDLREEMKTWGLGSMGEGWTWDGATHNLLPEQDPEAKKASDGVKESQKLYDNQFYAEAQKAMAANNGERYFYVAYGSGDNLDFWAGPHRAALQGADITVKGARKITLTLTPTAEPLDIGHRRGAYNEEVNLNLAGMTMRYSGLSKPINFLKLKPSESSYDPVNHMGLEKLVVSGIQNQIEAVHEDRKNIKGALGKVGLAGTAEVLKEFDIHSIIVDTLRNYIQKATGNPNVILLLPNINVICREHINTLIKNARADKSSDGVYELLEPKSRHKYDPELGILGFQENFLTNLLNSFGLDLHVVLKSGITKSDDVRAIPTTSEARRIQYEKSKKCHERMKEYFSVHDFYGKIERASNQGLPDHAAAIKTIIDKINTLAAGDYRIVTTKLTETDINILDFWGGSVKDLPIHKFPTFGGYRDFTERKEAVIVGDKALIKKYLYGSVDLDVKLKNIQEYKDSAALAKKNQNKYEQAAWSTPWKDDTVYTDDPYFNEEEAQAGIHPSLSSLDLKAIEQAAIYEASILGEIKAIPLHPLDSIILTNTAYNKTIRDIVFPKITGAGAFGDVSDLPDTFGYSDKDFTDTEKDYIKKQGIPIFRYNTTNPNVLDMKFKFSNVYFAALKTGFTKVVKRRAAAVAEGILPVGIGSFPIRTRGAAIAYLKMRNFSLNADNKDEILASLKSKVSLDLLESMESENPADAADGIAAILEKAEQGTNADLRGLVEVEQSLPGNPQSIMTDLAEEVFRNALSMNIKTLPLFHISNVHNMHSPCVVFAQDAGIVQSVRPERGLLNSFFSGLYQIMGYKHTITTSTATSEFSIIKNAPNYKKEDAKKKEQDALGQADGGIGR